MLRHVCREFRRMIFPVLSVKSSSLALARVSDGQDLLVDLLKHLFDFVEGTPGRWARPSAPFCSSVPTPASLSPVSVAPGTTGVLSSSGPARRQKRNRRVAAQQFLDERRAIRLAQGVALIHLNVDFRFASIVVEHDAAPRRS